METGCPTSNGHIRDQTPDCIVAFAFRRCVCAAFYSALRSLFDSLSLCLVPSIFLAAFAGIWSGWCARRRAGCLVRVRLRSSLPKLRGGCTRTAVVASRSTIAADGFQLQSQATGSTATPQMTSSIWRCACSMRVRARSRVPLSFHDPRTVTLVPVWFDIGRVDHWRLRTRSPPSCAAVCDNGAELFTKNVGQEFRCRFSPSRFDQLKELLLEPWAQPADSSSCHSSHVCAEQDIPGLPMPKEYPQNDYRG